MSDTEPRDDRISDTDSAQVVENAEVRVLILGFDEVFLAESRRAAERGTRALAQGDAPAVAGATAAAILLAAAACEARLSEYLTSYESEIGATAVQAIRTQRSALQQWRDGLAARAPTFRCGDSREYRALGCFQPSRSRRTSKCAVFATR